MNSVGTVVGRDPLTESALSELIKAPYGLPHAPQLARPRARRLGDGDGDEQFASARAHGDGRRRQLQRPSVRGDRTSAPTCAQ
jgi:hypothetical protein